jgi:hypothetical protein
MDELREWIRAAEAARPTCQNKSEFDLLIRHQKQRLEQLERDSFGLDRLDSPLSETDPPAHEEIVRKARGTTEEAASDLRMDRMFAVAIRDGKDLFLWLRLRRAKLGDIYYAIPTGRSEPERKKWDPHGSHHRDGRTHHKSFDQKTFQQQRQKPDSDFHGTEQLITRPISSDEPRAFGVICDPSKFSEVMEVPISMISSKKYETSIAVDLTEPNGEPIITPGGKILAWHSFTDSIPWISVTVFNWPPR